MSYEPRDQNGMTASDHARAATHFAQVSADQAHEELQALRLEVQELRQFCIMLLYNGVAGRARGRYWWGKLTRYPGVEK